MTNQELTTQLYGLKPLYKVLLEKINIPKDKKVVTFFAQWGKNYYQHLGEGIMIYGRATNGWKTFSRDVDVLFDSEKERIFACCDQMQWVEEHWHIPTKSGYKCGKSAFWRVIRGVAEHFYPENWSSHICWSDICKVAPDGANPDAELYKAQLYASPEVMRQEISILNPKHIILLIGNWHKKDYLSYLNNGTMPSGIQEVKWGKKAQYKTSIYCIENRYYYVTEHPQGKPEKEHIKKLIELVQNYN